MWIQSTALNPKPCLYAQADAEAVTVPSGEHALSADAEAVELLDGVGVTVGQADPAENAEALGAISLRRIQELIEVVVDEPGARLLSDRHPVGEAEERERDARVLFERIERFAVPGAADQLVPGQAEGFNADPQLRAQHDPVLVQLIEAGTIGCPRRAQHTEVEHHRLRRQHDEADAQRRVWDGHGGYRGRTQAHVHKLRRKIVRKRVRIGLEDVDLAQVDPEPLRQKLGVDDAAERGRLVEGDGVERGGVRGKQRAGLPALQK